GNKSCKKKGFDIRGLGGQVVAPGSIHPDNGECYEILNNEDIAPAPSWLLELYENGKDTSKGKYLFDGNNHNDKKKQRIKEGTKSGLNKAVERCLFLKFAKERPNDVAEPLWYAMMTNLLCFKGGREKIHEFSKPYNGYHYNETQEKIEHALNDAPGPHCCDWIYENGFEECRECKYWGKIKSPVMATNYNVKSNNIQIVSFSTIMKKQYKPVEFIVDDLLPAGFGIMAGRPKIGKSWNTLQLAFAAASGEKFLGKQTKKMKTLYMALEDSERRIHNRIKDWNNGLSVNNVNLDFVFEPVNINKLEAFIVENGYKFIVIDTLSRYFAYILDDQNNTQKTTNAMSLLHNITRKHEVNIMIIDHHKKPGLHSGKDLIDDILGSTAKGAVPDYIVGLYRKRSSRSAIFTIDGRDTNEYKELEIEFDSNKKLWKICGNNEKYGDLTRAEELVLRNFEETGGEATVPEIVEKMNGDRSNISKTVKELEAKGYLLRLENNRAGDRASFIYKLNI
ncbi:MAG: AAA family ATPase, partial [Candidatus Lokiarchaeota archaeon]|nr:AAA family ATPase [Candidatus Lokiarchaeota archaeon]